MVNQTIGKVPRIRFSEFNQDWHEKTFGELFPITSAARVHKNEWTTSGVPFFRSSDVVSHFKGETNTKAFISVELYRELSAKVGHIQRGDILVTGGGSIGIPFLVKNDEPLYFKDADLLWFKIREAADSNYLYTFFSATPFRRYLKSISHIGTIAHYTVEQAKGTPITLPTDFGEQAKIGVFFRRINQLIELHQSKHEKLVALKQAMLQKMFPQPGANTPAVRFQGFHINWAPRSLGEICEIVGGGTPSTAIPEYWNGTIDWYSPTEIGEKVFAEGSRRKITQLGLTKCSAKILPPHKTVLFTSRAGIGDMAILAKEGCTNQGFQSFVLNDDIDPYCFYSLGHQIKAFALRIASGSTFLEISSGQLKKMSVLLPDYEEQKKIGAYFRSLDALIAQHTTQLQKLRQIKSAFLSKMFV